MPQEGKSKFHYARILQFPGFIFSKSLQAPHPAVLMVNMPQGLASGVRETPSLLALVPLSICLTNQESLHFLSFLGFLDKTICLFFWYVTSRDFFPFVCYSFFLSLFFLFGILELCSVSKRLSPLAGIFLQVGFGTQSWSMPSLFQLVPSFLLREQLPLTKWVGSLGSKKNA